MIKQFNGAQEIKIIILKKKRFIKKLVGMVSTALHFLIIKTIIVFVDDCMSYHCRNVQENPIKYFFDKKSQSMPVSMGLDRRA